jgi:hypothetical protein
MSITYLSLYAPLITQNVNNLPVPLCPNIQRCNEGSFPAISFKALPNLRIIRRGLGMNTQCQMDVVAHHAKAKDIDEEEFREFVEQKNKMVLVRIAQREAGKGGAGDDVVNG